jgi:hypothetical protein
MPLTNSSTSAQIWPSSKFFAPRQNGRKSTRSGNCRCRDDLANVLPRKRRPGTAATFSGDVAKRAEDRGEVKTNAQEQDEEIKSTSQDVLDEVQDKVQESTHLLSNQPSIVPSDLEGEIRGHWASGHREPTGCPVGMIDVSQRHESDVFAIVRAAQGGRQGALDRGAKRIDLEARGVRR